MKKWTQINPLDPKLRSLISKHLTDDEVILDVIASDAGEMTVTLVGKKLHDLSSNPETKIPIFLAGRQLRFRFENGQWTFESVQEWIE